MQERCRALNAAGKPCAAQARPDLGGFCPWHAPELEAERVAWRKQGGHARSNANRARKAMKRAADVTPVLWTALNDLAAGTLEPARGQAMASVARALVAVHEATELEDRISALEQAAERSTA